VQLELDFLLKGPFSMVEAKPNGNPENRIDCVAVPRGWRGGKTRQGAEQIGPTQAQTQTQRRKGEQQR
jgi:hypothetical protein